MGSILGRKFDRGVDARRLPESTDGSALIRGADGHITRGGEFAKRAAFVLEYELPEGTASIAADANGVYVFGGAAEPVGMPADVTYQRLQSGSKTLERVVSWDLFEGAIYASAEFFVSDVEHFYDGVSVDRFGRAAGTLISVVSGAGGDTVDILVDGVSATGGPVAWVGTTSDMAAALADAINDTTSSPDYVADAIGIFVFLDAADVGAAANGREVTFTLTGTADMVVAGSLSGGVDAYITATRYVRTIGTKEYTLSGSHIQFSSVGDPTDWDGEGGGTGFGFIDTASYTSGADSLTALVEYRDVAAVFAERTIQFWSLAADPASNSYIRTLRNTGTSCPKSVTQYGDQEMFYLDESGLRSLRARDASGAASTYGVGVLIDPSIVAKLRSLTDAERENVIGLVEPGTGNFWLIMKDTIFVFSHFPDEKISAWTTYTTHYFDSSGTKVDFDVDDAVVFDRRVYLRSGDNIFAYGGITTGEATDATEAEVWTAYLDGDNPTTTKTWRSLDAAISGEWEVSIGMDLADTDTAEVAGIITQTTYNQERIGLAGQSTHISVRFRSRGDDAAVVSGYAVHFE